MIRPAKRLKRIYLYRHAVDFRKAVNGLSILVEAVLEKDPFDGTLFVFTNRARNRVKILWYERNGFCLWYKRLEQDRFVWPRGDEQTLKLSGQQLNWLLDGYDITQLRAHPTRRFSSVL